MCLSSNFIFLYSFISWMNPTFVTYWSAEGHLGCLCFLTTWMEWQCTRQRKCLWSRTCDSLGICPRMVELGTMAFIFGFLNFPRWFPEGLTSLQSDQQWKRVHFPHIFSCICCHFVWSLYSWKRSSPTSVASSLTRLFVSLAVKKPFGFMRTHLSIVGLNSWAYGILFKKTFSIPVSCGLPSSHYSSTSSVSGSGFGPPELVFVQGDRCRSVSFLCTWIVRFPSTVLKMLSLFQCMFLPDLYYIRCL